MVPFSHSSYLCLLTSELPRLSTYMSLDYSGVRLELYSSGVYVYRDDLHCLLRGCGIRYPRKNSKYVRRLKRLELRSGIKSRICFGICIKRCTKSPAKKLVPM